MSSPAARLGRATALAALLACGAATNADASELEPSVVDLVADWIKAQGPS